MKKFGILNLVALSVLVVVLTVLPNLLFINLKSDLDIENAFIGDASEFQGVLECWNIDTFEGGNISKCDFIERVARLFEQNHRGVYVSVKKVTIEEFKNKVALKELPDIIAFGQGFGREVLEYLQELNINNFEIDEKLAVCGKFDNKLFAVPMCVGAYALISTNEKIENASKEIENVKLLDIILDCGYVKKQGKKEKIVYSFNYGKNDFVKPLLAVGGVIKNEMVLESLSFYDAYNDFINFNRSTILLGNHRDVVKIENKERNGKIDGVIIEPIFHYNDLLHYIGVVKSENELTKKYASYFVKYIVSKTGQAELESSGLFSVCGLDLYDEGYLNLLESAFVKCENFSYAF